MQSTRARARARDRERERTKRYTPLGRMGKYEEFFVDGSDGGVTILQLNAPHKHRIMNEWKTKRTKKK